MRHLMSINEYGRTVGFRYSKPGIKYHGLIHAIGEIDEDSFSRLMNYLGVEFDNLNIQVENEKIQISEDEEVEINLTLDFNFYVYDEKEVETIADEVKLGLVREFDVILVNFLYKPAPLLK